MIENTTRRAACALILFCGALLAAGCGGGGGGGAPLAFQLTNLTPSSSSGLGGGEIVVITGADLDQVTVVSVRFGGLDAAILSVTASEIRVMTPGRPAAGTVDVDVDTAAAGSGRLPSAYEYRDAAPNPTSIAPQVFTPTGVEAFVISGTDLGPSNGTVQVSFDGVGVVTGTVNGSRTQVTGRAPLTPGPPPGNAVTVTLDPNGAAAAVPQTVTFDWQPPMSISVPFQATGGASRPVKIADGIGMLCTPGANGVWGDADDDVVMLTMPAGAPVLTIMRRAGGIPVGHLDPASSIVVPLDGTSCALYSVGPDATPGTGDDAIVYISGLPASPLVTLYNVPNMNGAPLARVDDDTVALTTAGLDGTLQTVDDDLMTFDFAPAGVFVRATVGPVDITPGFGNLSLPECPDGDAIFVTSPGPDLVPNTGDDTFRRYTISTGQLTAPTVAPNLLGRSVFLSATLVVNVGAGPNTTFGDADDVLAVFRENGNAFQAVTHALGGAVAFGAAVPFDRIGDDGVLVPVLGTSSGDVVRVYTDPFNDISTSYPGGGVPLLVALDSRDVIVLGPGPDRVAGTADDQAFVVGFATPPVALAPLPAWPLAAAVRGDATRAFAVTSGDGTFGNGDEAIQVFQSAAAGAAVSASSLPAADPTAPLGATEPLVPIGPSLGLVQSPGPDRVLGTGDDLVAFVRY